LHFGLELELSKDEAKAALRHALVTAQIRVPDRLLHLEADLRNSCSRSNRDANQKDTAARKAAVIYPSTRPVGIAPQRANERVSTSGDGNEDTSDRSSKDTSEKEYEDSECDKKTEPVRSIVTNPAALAAASSETPSSDESSTYSETKICILPQQPKFTLSKPLPQSYIRSIKTEPIERIEIRLEDPFVDAVQKRVRGVESQAMNASVPQAVPRRSVEGLDGREDNDKRLMNKGEFLRMREKLAESSDSINTKKRSHQGADESTILDQAQDFLISPRKSQGERKSQPKPYLPSQTKRPKISSILPTRADPKISSSSEHNVEKNFSSARSKPARASYQGNPKGLARPEPLLHPSQRHLDVNGQIP
jgi:hypothetical protein